MKDNIKISVIIPVYNVQNYLTKCLDSVLNQTFKDIEIIIVNDGSTDNSLIIINEYASKDDRIKVIDQKNKGLSGARNSGIKVAVGEYLSFIDSDDWIDSNMLKLLYENAKANDSDIAICSPIFFFEKNGYKKTVNSIFENQIFIKEDAIKEYFYYRIGGITPFAWDKIYKRELFVQNNVRYPEGMYYEDSPTTFKLLYYSKNVLKISNPLYYYVQRQGSITNSGTKILDRLKGLNMIKEFMIKEGIFEKYRNEFTGRYLKQGILLSLNQYIKTQKIVQDNNIIKVLLTDPIFIWRNVLFINVRSLKAQISLVFAKFSFGLYAFIFKKIFKV